MTKKIKAYKLIKQQRAKDKINKRRYYEAQEAIRTGAPPQFAGEKTIEKWNYKDYLQSDEWKAKAEQKKKENPNCSLCNRKGVLHTHHRTYVRCGKEDPNDLVVLCDECHREFHESHIYADNVGCFMNRPGRAKG